ncbi:MAG: hypothetical protein GY858_00450 [Candidatus Omnitrophica bacterium]|nr:hypothetical protein [Candidatus Omnitrophota bacterium]
MIKFKKLTIAFLKKLVQSQYLQTAAFHCVTLQQWSVRRNGLVVRHPKGSLARVPKVAQKGCFLFI